MAERKYQFERLTPIDNMDLDVYEEAIDYVFDNSDIKNVAISGAYSAGKSSVLASYKKNHSNLRFLHISLAHFKSPDQEDETEIKESVLEGKILNQLIHQIPSEKIPQTNFRVKKKVNTKSVIRLTIGAVLFLVSTIYFFCFDMWKNYLSSLPDNWFKTILTPSTHQYALMVDGVLMVALLSFVVYRLISVQKNKNIFRKLNLNGNEIEIFEESDDSYFDKYLNEVLYLFENADADVIVFEDMDDFDLFFADFLVFCKKQNYSKSWVDNTVSGLKIFLLAARATNTATPKSIDKETINCFSETMRNAESFCMNVRRMRCRQVGAYRETCWYIHLTIASFPELAEKLDSAFAGIIPVVGGEIIEED